MAQVHIKIAIKENIKRKAKDKREEKLVLRNKWEEDNKMVKTKNPWILHLMKVKEENKGKSLKECMAIAKKTYVPIKKK